VRVDEAMTKGERQMAKVEVPEETRDKAKVLAVLSKRPMWKVFQEAIDREEKERQEAQRAVR